jgi:hypothetical protein
VVESKNKQGDKGRVTKDRYCEVYKIPPTKMVWSFEKNVTPTNARTICNSYNGKDREGGRPRYRLRDEVDVK